MVLEYLAGPLMEYRLKKSLGQHFLKDDNISRKIVNALQENPFSQLLEVGPGAGALTRHLIQLTGIDFKAVELDDEKVAYLLCHFPSLKDQIIHKDFLHINPPFAGRFTVAGNFPYNISSQILFKILDWKEQVECMVGMFQKEVAMRVAAGPGSKVYGVTSVLVQAFFDVEYLFDVPPTAFNPPPKVMSGVIRLLPKTGNNNQPDVLPQKNQPGIVPTMSSEKQYKMLVKMAFNQRRKQLRNAVRPLFDDVTLKDEIFNKRAEQLSIEDFGRLTFLMKQ